MAENQEMAGEDASLDAATARIMGIGMANLVQDESKLDRLENTSGEVDLNDEQGTTDLEQIERSEALKAEEAEGDGEDAGAGEEPATFIELPSDEEGKEAERVPLAEAVEAIKQYRQFQGDIATAVTRVEEEAYVKQDALLRETKSVFDVVAQNARVTLAAMDAYLPQEPDKIMLDRNSGYYDPEGYHNAKIYYDSYKAYREQVVEKLKEAEKGVALSTQYEKAEFERREHAKTARFISGWDKPEVREARKGEILDILSKRYGVTKEDLDDIVDVKAWRMMNDLANMAKAVQKAPEVRKAVQEKAAKLVQGKLPPRDTGNGRFVSEARAELKKSGSEDAFANYLQRAGASQRRK